jgi:hypothetical protein
LIDEYWWTANLQRLMNEHMKSKKMLEINHTNPVVKKIIEQIEANAEYKSTK